MTRWEYTYVTSSPGDEEKLMPKFKELGQSGYELVTFLETPDHEAERIWLLRLRAGSLREDQREPPGPRLFWIFKRAVAD